MSIQFPDDVDVFMACGVKFDEEQVIASLCGRAVIGLTDQAKKAAIESQKPVFAKHREELQKISYGKLLQKIEKTRASLTSPEIPNDVRVKIAEKLNALAQKRIDNKESKFGFLRAFFHKLNQFFHGHGFQTKAQYGKQLADGLKESSIKNLEKSVAAWVAGTIHPNLVDLKKNINSLPDDKLRSLLNTAVFNVRSQSFAWPKYELYKLLTEKQQAIFREVLVERNRLLTDLRQIVNESDASTFIAALPAVPFQKVAEVLCKNMRKGKGDLYDLLGVERAFQGWIASKNAIPLAALVGLIKDPIVGYLKEPKLLTAEDVTYLQNNVQAFAPRPAQTLL